MNIFRTRTRRGAAILFSGILVLGGLALTSEASAVKNVDDNPTCEYLGFTYGAKWEEPSAGVYTLNRDGMEASLTVGTYPDKPEPNVNNAITAYTTSGAGDYAIVVKAGDAATVYDPGAAVPLHAPVNASGKWPTISHFDLCWNKPTPEPEVGSLQVTKKITGDAPANAEFTICIEGMDPLDPVATKQCKTFKVTGEGAVTFTGLELGTYLVTEPEPGSDYELVTIDPKTVKVTSEVLATTKVTNAYTPETPETPEVPKVPETPTVEALPPTVEVLPPTAPVTPTAPVSPAAPAEAAAQATLPTTGSEGGLAAIAAILVTTGVGLTLLGKRRGTQQA